MFVCEQCGAVPDILAIGKGFGGGVMPMAAIVAATDLDCAPHTALGHYTHEKSPVGCAAALATLEAIVEEGLVERARRLGKLGLELLNELKSRHSIVRDVRGLGAYFGVEIDGANKDEAKERAERLMYACLERGLSFKLGGGNVATLCPPLTIPDDELRLAIDILDEGLAAV
jgi:4-aminobutyrate aminotransferase